LTERAAGWGSAAVAAPSPLPLSEMRVLSIGERKAVLSPVPDLDDRWLGEAARLAQWWERTYFPGQPALFSRRLRADGLNRRTVVRLLAAGLHANDGAVHWVEPWRSPSGEDAGFDADVARSFVPLVRSAWSRVDSAIETLEDMAPALSVERGAIRQAFVEYLGQRLFDIAARVFILRLHVAKLERRLKGDTPEERFEYWARAELGDGYALAKLLRDFPVLHRSLTETADAAGSSWAEMLVRLAADWQSFPTTFGTPVADRIVSVQAGLGDTHNAGRTVMRLRMVSGLDVFYKPRPMAVDAHVQELFEWLIDRGLEAAPGVTVVIDGGDYGWMEAVAAAACQTPAEVKAFYRRQGSLLFALYMLDGSDIHSENVIAAGAHPVLVDLETMFQVRQKVHAEAAAVCQDVWRGLVLNTMLLPLRGQGPLAGVDVGGLSDLSGQASPRFARVSQRNTDTMRVVYEEVELTGSQNVPHLDGRPMRAADHVDEIVTGFTEAYRFALRSRDELLAKDGPVQAFASDRVRHVLRGTEEYSLLLRGSYHPSCLRDAAERGFVFDTLWLGTAGHPQVERVIASEQEDLMRGDIPYFTASVDSCDLVDSKGRVIEGFLATSGLSRVIDRIEGMSDDDMLRQIACIRGSFAAGSPVVEAPEQLRRDPGAEVSSTELVEEATRIGEQLVRLAHRCDGQAHWTGLVATPDGGFDYTVVGPDLYGGTGGIALFLAYLARATGRPDFDDLARAAYAAAACRLLDTNGAVPIGAFTGAAGLLYVALHLSQLWDDVAILDDALPVVDRIAHKLGKDRNFDVLDGSAGCVLVLLRVAERLPSSRALPVAAACGRHLIRHAVPIDGGLGWIPAGGGHPLLGLAHGAGGVAAALAQLARATANPQFGRAARRAIAYEQAHFDADIGNWPDFRDNTSDQPRWAWCHGAPGIGIARLMTGLDHEHESPQSDIAAALASTEGNGFGGLDTMCHGDLGNLDLFLLAARDLDDEAWRSRALRHASSVIERRREAGAWWCDPSHDLEPPSLMTGIAGVGYQLLRLADPDGVPSVLALEGP
jgi:type 2 lantibiotic biosynthesis protein LanM